MGWPTQFVASLVLRQDTPEQVIDTLKYMTERLQTEDYTKHPEHSLFTTYYWRIMLIGNYGSADSPTTLRFVENISGLGGVPLTENAYYLDIRSNFLNYNMEIERFLDWIAPYSQTQGFVGYKLPDGEQNPTLFYFKEGKGYLSKAISPELETTETFLEREIEKQLEKAGKKMTQSGKPWWWKPYKEEGQEQKDE